MQSNRYKIVSLLIAVFLFGISSESLAKGFPFFGKAAEAREVALLKRAAKIKRVSRAVEIAKKVESERKTLARRAFEHRRYAEQEAAGRMAKYRKFAAVSSDIKTAERAKRNAGLAGKTHPVTNVPFDNAANPVFDSKMDVQLPEEHHKAPDKVQFKHANEQLKKKVMNDPKFAKQFSEEQGADILAGETPDGYVWHHHEDTGKLQLVDQATHEKTGHTGGKHEWGGGSENR